MGVALFAGDGERSLAVSVEPLALGASENGEDDIAEIRKDDKLTQKLRRKILKVLARGIPYSEAMKSSAMSQRQHAPPRVHLSGGPAYKLFTPLGV